ncbi:hypothetical protein C8R46DRAFT_1104421 [Mycena filopes]|nr:hypothetical protein C8R46DRAFT_1104421 [Mycena filopes]
MAPDPEADSPILAREMEDFFAWSPPEVQPDPESHLLCPKLTIPPRAFYDKHLDDKLVLRRVRHAPKLVEEMAQVASEQLISLSGVPLPHYSQSFPDASYRKVGLPVTAVDANEVADFYLKTTADHCMAVVSTLVMHPREVGWITSLNWWRRGGYPRVGERLALDENWGLELPNKTGDVSFTDRIWTAMDPDFKANVKQVCRRFNSLANWQILAPSAESDSLLQDLGTLGLSSTFPFKRCATLNFPMPTSSYASPQDAAEFPWTIPDEHEPSVLLEPSNSTLRRSNRLQGIHECPVKPTVYTSSSKRGKSSPAPKIKPAASRRPKRLSELDRKLTPESLLQLAWCRAVRTDMTVIVFTNGHFERIGIRHRETQTLYLSDLIVLPCPGYAKIHIGLYIAILRDAFARNEVLGRSEEASTPTKSTGKRDREEEEAVLPHKKLRQSPPRELVPSDVGRATDAASTRNLVLILIRYGVFNSSAPASFVRCTPLPSPASPAKTARLTPIKRSGYKADEHIELTLAAEIAAGATGIVHHGTLQTALSDGTVLREEVVVKIAFLVEQQDKMRHEYAIYKHMAPFRVQGIPQVYGLFEDLEGGAMVLVMAVCGTCLWTLRPDPRDVKIVVTPEQRAEFIKIMESIHRAGVYHHDIRAENLMLDEKGQAFIIDFDCAELNPTEGKKQREMKRLCNLFDGSHPDLSIPSPPTTRDSNTDSDDHSDDYFVFPRR